MRKILTLTLAIALTASPAYAGGVGHRHARRATTPFCTTTANLPTPYTNPITGLPEFVVGGSLSCQGYAPMDVRLCPQLQVNGQWVFVRSSDGYGTCVDSGWQTQILTGMTGSFNCTPYGARSYVETWYWHNGVEYHTIRTSGGIACGVG